jgi:hypothetical protein
LALSVIRRIAIFLDAIGGIADIDRPQVLNRSVANDPTLKGQSLRLARAQDLFRANMKRERFSLGDKRLKRFFTTKQLADIRVKFKSIEGRTDRIVVKYVSYPFKNEQAREYALHGLGRRVGTLRRCIENAFKTVPPSTVKVPVKSKLYDAQINVQAFIANAYGSVEPCLDMGA